MSVSWTKHPVLAIPSKEECVTMAKAGVLEEFYTRREELIRLEKLDPYNYGFDHHNTKSIFSHWEAADEAMDDPEVDMIYLFGGNRGGKSRYMASRVVRAMVNNPKYNVWACHSSNDSSIQVQQPYIYEYLPLEWKEQKRAVRAVVNIGFTQKNGFSNRTFVGPNKSQCWFKNYTQDLGTLEGTELDLIWMDELVPLAWLQTLKYRLVTRKGKMVVTFTPIQGYTPTVKDAMEGAIIEETQPARMLEEEHGGQGIQGVPKGHMPSRARTRQGTGKIFWFFSEWNPYSDWGRMKRTLKGRTREEIEIRAYGYVSNPVVGKFPRFTNDNIIKAEDIPKEGTNYMCADPTPGDRNWFFLWARVDDLGRIYIYREWPDHKNYGEWAEPSNKLDGKAGPAQTADCGRNIAQYKKLIRELEKTDGGILERYIDPRAGKTAMISARNQNQTLIDLMSEPDRGAGSEVVREGMHFLPAQVTTIDETVALVNNLFAYNANETVSIMNEPRLYVSSECKNLIYALRTWTGEDKDKGACKDPVDCLRYLVSMDPIHVERQMSYTSEVGSY
jgi:hypothetical protein